MYISEAIRPIAIKFYRKHHLGREKAILGFGLDRIGTLVSMATDSSHRVEMRKWGDIFNTLTPSLLIGSSCFLQVRRATLKSRTSSNFDSIRTRTAELATLERLKNPIDL